MKNKTQGTNRRLTDAEVDAMFEAAWNKGCSGAEAARLWVANGFFSGDDADEVLTRIDEQNDRDWDAEYEKVDEELEKEGALLVAIGQMLDEMGVPQTKDLPPFEDE